MATIEDTNSGLDFTYSILPDNTTTPDDEFAKSAQDQKDLITYLEGGYGDTVTSHEKALIAVVDEFIEKVSTDKSREHMDAVRKDMEQKAISANTETETPLVNITAGKHNNSLPNAENTNKQGLKLRFLGEGTHSKFLSHEGLGYGAALRMDLGDDRSIETNVVNSAMEGPHNSKMNTLNFNFSILYGTSLRNDLRFYGFGSVGGGSIDSPKNCTTSDDKTTDGCGFYAHGRTLHRTGSFFNAGFGPEIDYDLDKWLTVGARLGWQFFFGASVDGDTRDDDDISLANDWFAPTFGIFIGVNYDPFLSSEQQPTEPTPEEPETIPFPEKNKIESTLSKITLDAPKNGPLYENEPLIADLSHVTLPEEVTDLLLEFNVGNTIVRKEISAQDLASDPKIQLVAVANAGIGKAVGLPVTCKALSFKTQQNEEEQPNLEPVSFTIGSIKLAPAVATPPPRVLIEPSLLTLEHDTIDQLKANIAALKVKLAVPVPDQENAGIQTVQEALKDLLAAAAYAELMAAREENLKTTNYRVPVATINLVLANQKISDPTVCLHFFELALGYYEHAALTQNRLEKLGALTPMGDPHIQPQAQKADPQKTKDFVLENFGFSPVGEVLFIPRDVHILIIFKHEYDFIKARYRGDPLWANHPKATNLDELTAQLKKEKDAASMVRLKSMIQVIHQTWGNSLGNGFTICQNYTGIFGVNALLHEEGHEMDALGPYFTNQTIYNGAAMYGPISDSVTEAKRMGDYLTSIYRGWAIFSLHTEMIQYLRNERLNEGNFFMTWKDLYSVEKNYDLKNFLSNRYKDNKELQKIASTKLAAYQKEFDDLTEHTYQKLLLLEVRFKKGLNSKNEAVKATAMQEKQIVLAYLSIRGISAWDVDILKLLDLIHPKQAQAIGG